MSTYVDTDISEIILTYHIFLKTKKNRLFLQTLLDALLNNYSNFKIDQENAGAKNPFFAGDNVCAICCWTSVSDSAYTSFKILEVEL